MKTRLRNASSEDLQVPTTLVLPDVQHLLLLSAGAAGADMNSSSSSSSSKVSELGPSSSSPKAPPVRQPAPPPQTPSESPAQSLPNVASPQHHLQYARHLLAFHYQGAPLAGFASSSNSSGGGRSSSSSSSSKPPSRSGAAATFPGVPVFEPLLAKAAQVRLQLTHVSMFPVFPC